MRALDKIFPNEFVFQKQWYFFSRALWFLVILQLLYGVPFLLGKTTLVSDPWTTQGIHYVFHLLELYEHPFLRIIFLFIAGFSIWTLFKKRWELGGSFLLWFTYVNLINSLSGIETGANSLISIFLFLQVVFHFFKSMKNEMGMNFSIRVLQIQVCVVYLVSTLYKLYGEHWLDGSAIHHLMSNEVYNLFYPVKVDLWLSKIMVYSVLVYQCLFPLFIWIRKFKTVLIFVGVGIHLGIMLMMGLFFFSLVMIISYFLFMNLKPE